MKVNSVSELARVLREKIAEVKGISVSEEDMEIGLNPYLCNSSHNLAVTVVIVDGKSGRVRQCCWCDEKTGKVVAMVGGRNVCE